MPEGGDPVGGGAGDAGGAGARYEQVQFGRELDVDLGTVHPVAFLVPPAA
ncbi:hypothetical protein [Streptomyces sp. NPDC046988]